MFVIAIPVLLGFVGLAIDMANMYSRKIEMQQIADAVAVAAASELDGTKNGAKNSRVAANNVAKYSFYNASLPIFWDGSALSFASSPDAPDSAWIPSNSVTTDPLAAGLVFARVDTTKLSDPFSGDDPSAVQMIFATFLPGAQEIFNFAGQAVAGKVATPITPLAVCAMSASPTGTHTNVAPTPADPLDYGFRTGVSYNLLQLNPSDNASRQAFLVNPVDPADHSSNVVHFGPATMKPFICAGSVALGHLGAGSNVYVQPLATNFVAAGLNLSDWLNSRFGASTCNAQTAPPDSNVREFNGNPGDYPQWYMVVQQYTVAASDSATRKAPAALVAFADLTYLDGPTTINAPTSPTETSFGPLWAYKKPTGFNGSQWPNMYHFSTGAGAKSVSASVNYPTSGLPYDVHVKAPTSGGGVKYRRVLNIPLLDCSAGTPPSKASVLAIGQFFMTAKATDTVIAGEFAGTIKGTAAVSSGVLYK
jgi:hypothetical protein